MRKSSTVYRLAILLSDGKSSPYQRRHIPNNCSWENITIAAEKVKGLEPPVFMYTIGVDYENETELREIATTRESYTHIKNISGLADIRDSLMYEICWKGKLYYNLDEV